MRFFIFCLLLFPPLLFPGGVFSALAAENTHTNSIGMEFILVPAGSFLMGGDPDLDLALGNETPRHRVNLTRPFYLGKYEVTQEQWTAVMGGNPSKFKGKNNPVENVSWNDIQNFVKRLNQKEGHARYRLPTEAEWEYAARAGTTAMYSFGDDAYNLELYAWYADNSSGTGSSRDRKAHAVGQKKPNAWGFYDMHGNVLEYAQDWYAKEYYTDSPDDDPQGPPPSGGGVVVRGGSWVNAEDGCRSAFRAYNGTDHPNDTIGFRLALSLEESTD
jgi:formylglycine-generating enzyme required for sulfatase activity